MGTPKPQETEEDFGGLYDGLRSLPEKKWKKMKPKELAMMLKGDDAASSTPAEDLQFGKMIMLAAKIAHQVDRAEFIEFMRTGESRTVKLTPEEKAILKGE